MANLVTFVDLHHEIIEIFDYLLEVIVVIYFASIGHVPRSKLLLIFRESSYHAFVSSLPVRALRVLITVV